MAERELTATVGDVSAVYDHRGRLEAVEIRLSYETSHETNVGKRRVTYGSPAFRFAVDADGIARLAEFDSRSSEGGQDEPEGALLSDIRAIPAAVEIVAEIGDVERVEPVSETIAGRIDEIEGVEFERE